MAGCCNHKLSLKKRPRRHKQLLIACGPYHWEAVGGKRHLQYDPHSWHHQKEVHHNAVSSKPPMDLWWRKLIPGCLCNA